MMQFNWFNFPLSRTNNGHQPIGCGCNTQEVIGFETAWSCWVMKTRYIGCIALVLFLAGVGLSSANADTFVYRIDDLTDSVTSQLLRNGNVERTISGVGETLNDTVFLFPPPFLPLQANIFDPTTGVLSDTYRVVPGFEGSPFITFASDVEGGPPLVPLTGAGVQTITENGLYQSIGSITLLDGSTVDFQFRSDVEGVPEPSTFVL